MLLEFEKWHGRRNDFIVTWISDAEGALVRDSIARQAVTLCDRHAGVGADGVLILTTKMRDDLTPYALTIINSDGSLAQNCGNGLRCAALSVLKRHKEKGDAKDLPEAVAFDVAGSSKICRFLRPTGQWPLVVVEMGVAVVNDAVTWAPDARQAVGRLIGGEVGVCDIGNPHIVINTDQASRALALTLGPALQRGGPWDGMNVHLVKSEALTDRDQARAGNELGQRLGEVFRAYVWERGAGETQACGSGACAIAACALDTGLNNRNEWIAVDMPGGRLYVKQEHPDDPVLLAGPGVYVFSGKFPI